MKNLTIAFVIISILAATGIQSWAESKVTYLCYSEKTKQTRYFNRASDCKTPEIAMAASPAAQTGAADSQDQQSSTKGLQQDLSMPFSHILSSDGGGSSGSP